LTFICVFDTCVLPTFLTRINCYKYVSECGVLVILLLSVLGDLLKYLSNAWFTRQVEITQEQKRLLGVRDNGKQW